MQSLEVGMSELVKLMKLVLVLPATNTISERAFSALKRVKTYMRSTMTGTRLNQLMKLHIHSERTDSINLADIPNEFCSRNEKRLFKLGTFSIADKTSSTVVQKDQSTQTL